MTKNVASSTQRHLPIDDIIDSVVILKNGGAVVIIETTAVNFELLSEPEQDAMIDAFGHLLNSLSFHMQLVIRSKRLDISNYVARLQEAEDTQTNPLLKQQITGYKHYIADLISKNEVLDKAFYLVIPYSKITTSAAININPLQGIKNVFGAGISNEPKKASFNKQEIYQKARIELEPKKEHILKQLTRLGLKGHVLNHEELIELFYDIYNPEVARKQKLQNEGADYKAHLVGVAIAE